MLRRRGYTLIELLATLAITGALLTLLAGWLTATMRSQGAAGEHLLTVNVEDRLARQFRQDVHAARSVLPLEGIAQPEVLLRLDLNDHEVLYLRGNRHLQRVEEAKGTLRRQEQYWVRPEQVRFESGEGDARWIRLILGRPESNSEHPDVRVEAVLGSDRRFERSGK